MRLLWKLPQWLYSFYAHISFIVILLLIFPLVIAAGSFGRKKEEISYLQQDEL